MSPPRRPAVRRLAVPRAAVRRTVACAVVAAAFVAGSLLLGRVRVESTSMEPTLRAGDHLLVDERAYWRGTPRRGDLVVFDHGGSRLVKRVAAVAGDTVGIEDGVLTVDGRPVTEPAIDRRTLDGLYYGPAHVPPGTVFVLGDNRRHSVDSRQFGPVPVGEVTGRVLLRWWPSPGAP
ncbi:signal peptidase I [Streptomyces sp. M2CJ-2]|uniref:signal peptidase I n=1 Tax=Streptomyces sp. M2CJ-2 TaxID=2803948 RepID=UPI0019251E22|nr:signal peptidase I [Streptomyces sp. M2CJ-2]MBL3667220.1 signal peptidase I [Streptomyces sp. M2CJ-2]